MDLAQGMELLSLTREEMALSVKLEVRQPEPNDYNKGILQLLQQLSSVGCVSAEAFELQLQEFKKSAFHHLVVVEDVVAKRIIATGTLVVEPKFIRNVGLVGHLEDVVVDAAFRRKGLGRCVVNKLTSFASKFGCYKVIVDCSEDNVAFYESCGFKRKDASLVRYFQGDTCPDHTAPLKQALASSTVGEFTIRALHESDFDRGFLKLLEQLTVVGEVSKEAFGARLKLIEAEDNQHVIVIEQNIPGSEPPATKIVGTGTVVVEQKLIHDIGKAGHAEDVVVDSACRGKGLGKVIIDKLQDIAAAAGCYKIILDCSESNVPFYQKCEFSLGHSPVCMALYF